MNSSLQEKAWHEHKGPVIAESNGYEVIECEHCGFSHIIPVPTNEELEEVYRQEYYSDEKPQYIDRHTEDSEWWRLVYDDRYDMLERFLSAERRRILDIGSGPGSFLLAGRRRGWTVKGIEPSIQAWKYSSEVLGLDVVNDFFSTKNVKHFGSFDAINMSEVLEHIPDPVSLLKLVRECLAEDGLLCINVPNDFNPFQIALQEHCGYNKYWVAPPHHINYFNFDSLARFVEHCGFEVIHKDATFPIDLFLLMGENYIGNDLVGRQCHMRRMNFEKNLQIAGLGNLRRSLYKSFASLALGREITLYARKG